MRTCPKCGKTFELSPGDLCAVCLITSRLEAERPNGSAFASSAWMDEAEAALVLAEKAERNCGLEGEWNSLVALEGAVRGLRAALALARRPSSINPHEPRP